MFEKPVGATDQTIDVFVRDSRSVEGAGLTGLVYNSTGLTCYYRKGAKGTPTALALATQTVTGTHSDGGFVAVDGTNCPGQYRLDLSDVMVDSAGLLTIYLQGPAALNMVHREIEIEVVAANKFTGLPNANWSGTLRVFGDDLALGTGLSSPSTTRYSKLVCEALGMTESNLAVANSQACDPVPVDTISALTITAADNSLLALGYNNYRYTGNTSLLVQDNVERGLAWDLALLTIPRANLVLYGAAIPTGTWVADASTPPGMGYTASSTNGDYIEGTVSGSTVLVGVLLTTGSTGTADIAIDGVTKLSISCAMAQASYNAGGSGRTHQGAVFRISGLTNASHTVRMTVTSASGTPRVIFFSFLAGLNGTPMGAKAILVAPPTMPAAGYALSTPLNNGSDAMAHSFINRIFSVYAQAKADGCRVFFVSGRVRTDRQFQAGSINYNEDGHAEIYRRILGTVLLDESIGRPSNVVDAYGDLNGKVIGQGTGTIAGTGAWALDSAGAALATAANLATVAGYLDTEIASIISSLATLTTYVDTEVAAIKAKTDNLPTDPADESNLQAAIAALATSIATLATYVDTEVAAIKAKTDNLPSDPADASDLAGSFSTVNATLATIAAYIDTEVAAIKAKTDALPSDPADESNLQAAIASLASSLATLATYVDTEVAAIKAKTDNLPALPAAEGSAMTLTVGERDAIAVEVESHLLDEGDAQMLINAIVAAIGNANIDQVVLVAAIRADLERSGGNLNTLLSRITGNIAPQTGDSYARLGAPAGASVSADIALKLPTSGYTAPPSTSDINTALGVTHGAGSWATATSVTVSDKTGFSLADVDGVAFADYMRSILATLFGVATVTGGDTVTFMRRDGITPAVVVVLGAADGERDTSTIS